MCKLKIIIIFTILDIFLLRNVVKIIIVDEVAQGVAKLSRVFEI